MTKHITYLYKSLAENPQVRSATVLVDKKTTAVLTRQGKPDRRNHYNTYLLTVGTPNFKNRLQIKKAETFPVRLLHLYPAKKAKR